MDNILRDDGTEIVLNHGKLMNVKGHDFGFCIQWLQMQAEKAYMMGNRTQFIRSVRLLESRFVPFMEKEYVPEYQRVKKVIEYEWSKLPPVKREERKDEFAFKKAMAMYDKLNEFAQILGLGPEMVQW